MAKRNNEPSLLESISNIKEMLSGSNTKNTTKNTQMLMEKTAYQVTPSFIKHNGRVMAILNMYVRPNSNRHLSFQDVLDFIPISTLDGVEIHLMSKDMMLKGQQKQKIVKKNSGANKRALNDSSKYEKEKKTSDNSMEAMRQAKIEDFDDYEMILDSPEPLMVFKWLLIVIGETEQQVDEQIESINVKLDQMHDGAKWDSLPAEQLDEFTGLFDAMTPNIYDHTSTGNNYSGLSFALNAGIMDKNGVPIGVDALSLSGATAFFDFDRSTQRQAFILAPRNSKIPRYVKPEEFSTPSMSSMAAQAAANQIMMAGHRAHHIVLNDFDYFEKDRYYAAAETSEIFEGYDVSRLSINPLQGFGHIDQVQQIYSRLVQKIVNIFKILMNFELDSTQEAAILGAVNQFYYNQRLWSTNADKSPHSTRIVNISKPETYPTMGLLLNEFSSLAKQAAVNNRENKADNLDALEMILRQTLSTYMSVLGRTTTIQESSKPQVYYNFKNIDSLQMRQVQLLNILEFIIYTAKPKDVIVIHGYDNILATVALMMEDTIKAAQNNGIRFIFAFDSIVGSTGSAGKMNDVFELQPTLYKDLDNDADWSFIGKVVPSELEMIKTALNQELGPTVEALLVNKAPNQVLVHRHFDQANNFIRLSPTI